jgi:hypothetical protein
VTATDWRTATVCTIKDGHVLGERGEPLARVTGSPWRWWLGRLLSIDRSPRMVITDPAGTPLFGFTSKQGSFRSWIKVFDPDGALIARLDRDGTIFTKWRERFTIRDASGVEIGKVDNPRHGYEFVLLDHAGTRIAQGVRREVYAWEVRRDAAPAGPATPWPELTIAFFFCVLTLIHRPAT